MTTESPQDARTGLVPLLAGLVAGLVVVALLSVVAAVTDGSVGVAGTLVGGVLTLAVFALGIALVSAVARLLPSASLLVALLTYTLQLLVLAIVVAALERSGLAGAALSRGWFAAGVIAATATWLTGQVVAAQRQRIAVYDGVLPGDGPGGER